MPASMAMMALSLSTFLSWWLPIHGLVTVLITETVSMKVHGFILSTASPFIRDVLANTFSPNLEYSLLLPEMSSTVVSCLSQLLYGVTVVTSRDTLVQLYRLVDILGIQMTLITEAANNPILEADDDIDRAQENNTLVFSEHVIEANQIIKTFLIK